MTGCSTHRYGRLVRESIVAPSNSRIELSVSRAGICSPEVLKIGATVQFVFAILWAFALPLAASQSDDSAARFIADKEMHDCAELQACSSQAVNSGEPEDDLLSRLHCVFKYIYHEEPKWDELRGRGIETIYGEIPPESVARIADALDLGPGAVFYDLGSGFGRMVLQVHLTTRASLAVGVEIVEERHKVAEHALDLLNCAKLQTLLPVAPGDPHSAKFLQQDFNDLDMSDATAIYMASLYFPKEVMWMLARKLSALKDGTRILSLVKFPFDMYGKRKLALDDPIQALRLRNPIPDVRMSWSEENMIYVYEVDRAEAFAPPFNAAAAGPVELLTEAYRRSGVGLAKSHDLHTPNITFHAVLSLGIGRGSVFCELGTTNGWLALRVALETEVEQVVGVSTQTLHNEAAKKMHHLVEELAPGRIPWYRKPVFASTDSLQALLTGDAEARHNHRVTDFAALCGRASIVVLNALHDEGLLDVLAGLAKQLSKGTVIFVLVPYHQGHITPRSHIPGLLPMLEEPLELKPDLDQGPAAEPPVLHVFAVAPSDALLADLKLPELSSLRMAVSRTEL